MGMARTNKTRGSMPDPQSGRGFPRADSKNPKSRNNSRFDSIGSNGDGTTVNPQGPGNSVTTNFPESDSVNRKNKGGALPDDAVINRGYSYQPFATPSVTSTSANRQRFGGQTSDGGLTSTKGDSYLQGAEARPTRPSGANGDGA